MIENLFIVKIIRTAGETIEPKILESKYSVDENWEIIFRFR